MTAPYAHVIAVEAARHHVPAYILAHIVERESHWDTFAIGAANERGLMQIKPSLARVMCAWEARLLHWPQPNISCGARILRAHFRRCKSWIAAASAFNGSAVVCGVTTYGLEITMESGR